MDWPAAWARFCALPHTADPPPGGRQAWLRGRARYSAWVLRVGASEAVRRVRQVAQALSPWLRPLPSSDLHITVWVAGFVDGPGAEPLPPGWVEDSVDAGQLAAQARALSGAACPRLRVGSASCFEGCAVLEVDDAEGALEGLRARLSQGSRDLRFSPYAPHVTVGLFHPATPTGPIVQALAGLRALPPIPLSFDRIERVEWDARVPLSPLQTAHALPLGDPP